MSSGQANKETVLNLALKRNLNLKYALGGLSNKIFASKYITYMPSKDEMIRQVELIIEKNK